MYKPAKNGETMFYLVAGCINQPLTAFDFVLDELSEEGGVTLVRYRNILGCNIKTIAAQVCFDIEKHDYQAIILGVSIGDYVARMAEYELSGVKSIPINPEPDSSILRPWARTASRVGSVVVSGMTVLLGWASLIPWLNGDGNWFSTAFIADQFRDIGFIEDAPRATDGVMGVLISEYDEYLVNSKIEQRFQGVPIISVMARHGKTGPSAEAYSRAWIALRQHIGSFSK